MPVWPTRPIDSSSHEAPWGSHTKVLRPLPWVREWIEVLAEVHGWTAYAREPGEEPHQHVRALEVCRAYLRCLDLAAAVGTQEGNRMKCCS